MQETFDNDRLLSLIQNLSKQISCNEATEAMRNLSISMHNLAFVAGRAGCKNWSLTQLLLRKMRQPLRKMPRKQKKAYIKKHGRAAYYAWQRVTPFPQFTPWRVPIPDFNIKFIRPKFPDPMIPDRNLLFLSDLWSKQITQSLYDGYKPIIWVPNIG